MTESFVLFWLYPDLSLMAAELYLFALNHAWKTALLSKQAQLGVNNKHFRFYQLVVYVVYNTMISSLPDAEKMLKELISVQIRTIKQKW